jgi:hypothetical protein
VGWCINHTSDRIVTLSDTPMKNADFFKKSAKKFEFLKTQEICVSVNPKIRKNYRFLHNFPWLSV